ncbi:WD repeat-containing protein 34-like [Fopius arisanus]|uniref:WD repeat-containing protein 34-like n=1 Tax=Fopius arisanus TaxID=64838 RepID=A0A9R1TMA2_9HYME|nr:PREDICTED: WD repeat-containing protein 34-like [Fopius arisanus]
MFSDNSSEPSGFSSAATTVKEAVSNAAQTENIRHDSKQSQNITQQSAQTQTAERITAVTDIDYNRLAEFLRKVTPGIMEALDNTSESDILDGYDPIATKEITLQVKLLNKFPTLEESDSKRKISALTWSTHGGTLAIAYSIPYHEQWCDHLSEIKFYELKRDDDVPPTANKHLETNACITDISYHPTKPSIFAAGFFNGDVALWNLADEESVVPLLVCVHGDVVTSLLWRERTINEPHLLITSSADGYIFIHKLTANFTIASLHNKYKIVKEHNPTENTRPRSAGGRKERAAEAGLSITCLDFSLKNPIFIVGTLCGGLYKCSLDSSIPVQGDDKLFDPVIDEYDRYEGSVTALRCSQTTNLFISSGTNMELRVYDVDQICIIRVIAVEHTVIGLKWFPYGKEIISAYGADSSVNFYDISHGRLVTNLKIESTTENITAFDFNKKRDTAALADSHGNLEIWKMPKQAIQSG